VFLDGKPYDDFSNPHSYLGPRTQRMISDWSIRPGWNLYGMHPDIIVEGAAVGYSIFLPGEVIQPHQLCIRSPWDPQPTEASNIQKVGGLVSDIARRFWFLDTLLLSLRSVVGVVARHSRCVVGREA